MSNNYTEAIALHKKYRGKISVEGKVPLESREDLALAYTPGVAGACLAIADDVELAYDLTSKGSLVAVVTDGSAVLGLGDIGAEAALPVMEGKAAIFKKFADVDAFPICLSTNDPEEIITAVKHIAPGFGGINLEDIAAPACFEIERRLREELSIPVMHDDQHGTATVVLAGLINATKLAEKDLGECQITVSGVGSAGVAIMKLLKSYAPKCNIKAVDSKGVVWEGRDDLSGVKQELIDSGTISGTESGDLMQAITGSDIFLGVSRAGLLGPDHIKAMAPKPIVFAMANPEPEIMPDIAKEAGAFIVATGRSDFPNQINNSLVFPGIFAGILKARIQFSQEIFIAAAEALAQCVGTPSPGEIIPDPFDERAPVAVEKAVLDIAQKSAR